MFRIFIARIILFLDQKFKFISETYVSKYLTVPNKKNGYNFASKKLKKDNLNEPTPRQYYALVLFWKGIYPHPKFEFTKTLDKSYTKLQRIYYKTFKLILILIQKMQSNRISDYQFENKNTITLEFLTRVNNNISHSKTSVKNTTIIIPVFNGIEYVEKCISSVLKTTSNLDILVIDDASTDKRTKDLLKKLKENRNIRLIENDTNLGFVKSANIGLKNSGDNDVVLLNSDTIVYEGWLEGLKQWLERANNIATVTPLSNSATIYSLPFDTEFECDPIVTETLAKKFLYQENSEKLVKIPTCHGFCVLITRQAINQIGFLDEQTFGLGYGEENDFSMRAQKEGFIDVLATNVVVHHFGSKSFNKEQKLKAEYNLKKLLNKHPEYLSKIDEFLTNNELAGLRLTAFSCLIKNGVFTIDTHLTHRLGGGVDKSILYETENFKNLSLLIKPHQRNVLSLEFILNGYRTLFYVDLLDNQNSLIGLFSFFGLEKIKIQHLIEFNDSIIMSLKDWEGYKILRIHDYYYLCPRIHLTGTNYSDCKLPNEFNCNTCIHKTTLNDIATWRLDKLGILNQMNEISLPSNDTLNRYRSIFKNLQFTIKNFDLTPQNFIEPKSEKRDKIHIGIIGELTRHKGFDVVTELLESDNIGEFFFHIYGELGSGLNLAKKNVKVHGRYESLSALSDLISDTNPDIILFPSKVPETYSYALSEALLMKRPIVYFKLGAVHERLKNRSDVLPLDTTLDAFTILRKILEFIK